MVCKHNPETVVLAHLNGAGMGLKNPDIFGAYACYACHQAVDGAVRTQYTRNELRLFHLEGVIRTQRIMLGLGLINT